MKRQAGRTYQETNHPIVVTPESDTPLKGCGETACRAWGSGILRLEVNTRGQAHSATAILTAAGCELCEGPMVTQGDIGRVVGSFEPPVSQGRDEVRASAISYASQQIGASVQEFIGRD